MDAIGRATQESKPRTPKVGALGDAGAIVESTKLTKKNKGSLRGLEWRNQLLP